MTLPSFATTQDFHAFIEAYRERFADDVLTIAEPFPATRTSPPWSTPWPPGAATRC